MSQRIRQIRLLLLALALVLAACASDGETATAATDDAVAETGAVDESDDTEQAADDADDETESDAASAPAPSGDEINGGKPVVEIADGDAPLTLVTDDLIEGEGSTAEAGDLLVMHYVGVLHEDGSQFDSSWDRGATFNFTLGEGRVIQGWDEGIVGMQVGGRRQLTIPAEQAYGAQSPSPDIPANSPLVFVVDLVAAISRPDIENVSEPATELEVTTLEEGDGAEVQVGDTIEVHFEAILQSTGELFASSFNGGQALVFEIGAEPSQILPGWDEALPGQTVGSWVRVVIPPELGIPEETSGVAPETLVTEVFILGVQ